MSETATSTEIRAAWKELAKNYHPDGLVNRPRLREEVEEKLKEINEAYEILSDPRKRRQYDELLASARRRNRNAREASSRSRHSTDARSAPPRTQSRRGSWTGNQAPPGPSPHPPTTDRASGGPKGASSTRSSSSSRPRWEKLPGLFLCYLLAWPVVVGIAMLGMWGMDVATGDVPAWLSVAQGWEVSESVIVSILIVLAQLLVWLLITAFALAVGLGVMAGGIVTWVIAFVVEDLVGIPIGPFGRSAMTIAILAFPVGFWLYGITASRLRS